MVYLVKEEGKVRVFRSQEEMKEAGYKKAGLAVSEEEFNSNGCYARILDGEIVVGKTEEEKAEEEKQEKINGYLMELAELDRQAGAGRIFRDIGIAYGQANGMTNVKGYKNLVAIEARAAEIRQELAPLLPPEEEE